ncbi:hypothetical protein Tco_1446257 [Tanacetum coccineum]
METILKTRLVVTKLQQGLMPLEEEEQTPIPTSSRVHSLLGLKDFFDDLRVTAAKLLLLVLKVDAAGMKVTTVERLQLLEEFMLIEKRSKTYQRKNKD